MPTSNHLPDGEEGLSPGVRVGILLLVESDEHDVDDIVDDLRLEAELLLDCGQEPSELLEELLEAIHSPLAAAAVALVQERANHVAGVVPLLGFRISELLDRFHKRRELLLEFGARLENLAREGVQHGLE